MLQSKKLRHLVSGGCLALAMAFSSAGAKETTTGVTLTWDFPHNVSPSPSLPVQVQHKEFSNYAWELFVGVNWPSDSKGQPIKHETIGEHGDNDTVWQHWIDSETLFREYKPGEEPTWPSLVKKDGAKPKVLKRMTSNHLNTIEQPGMAPLVDQNGEFAYYEVLLNRVMFDTIKSEGLYTENGQRDLPKNVDFHCGKDHGGVGAMLVKIAWKVMGAADEVHKFHRRKALIEQPGAEPREVEVGLVGMHITHKTSRSPQWNWITFDHKLNAPHYVNGKLKIEHQHYSFFDVYGSHDPKDFNQPPARPWDSGDIYPPTQLVRLGTYPKSTLNGGPNFVDETLNAVNKTYQKALLNVSKKSVWAHYQLVGVQWPFNPPLKECELDPANPLGTPLPDVLANPVIESYQQGIIQNGKTTLVPHGSSSCIHCHGRALDTQGRFSDFTFTLGKAKPIKKPKPKKEEE